MSLQVAYLKKVFIHAYSIWLLFVFTNLAAKICNINTDISCAVCMNGFSYIICTEGIIEIRLITIWQARFSIRYIFNDLQWFFLPHKGLNRGAPTSPQCYAIHKVYLWSWDPLLNNPNSKKKIYSTKLMHNTNGNSRCKLIAQIWNNM